MSPSLSDLDKIVPEDLSGFTSAETLYAYREQMPVAIAVFRAHQLRFDFINATYSSIGKPGNNDSLDHFCRFFICLQKIAFQPCQRGQLKSFFLVNGVVFYKPKATIVRLRLPTCDL